MKKILKISLKTSIILFLTIMIGFILIFYSYKIPSSNLKKNVYKSFKNDSNYLNISNDLGTYKSTWMDVFISGVIIGTTIYDNPEISTINKSLNNYFIYDHVTYKSIRVSLEDYLETGINITNEKYNILPYTRYWHGYVVPMKILLTFFNLFDIMLIEYLFQTFLVVLICLLMYKKNLKQYIVYFLSCYIMMMPMYTYKVLAYYSMFNIMLIGSAFVLLFYNKIKVENFKYIFLLIGSLSSYFDLLTFPMITISYPLIFWLLLSKKNTKQKLIDVVIFSIFWIIGYLGMWIGKWILSAIILKKDVFKDIYEHFLIRTIGDYKGLKPNLLTVINNNFLYLLNPFSLTLIYINLIYIIYRFFKIVITLIINQNKKLNFRFSNILPYILVMCMPLVGELYYVSIHMNMHILYIEFLPPQYFVCL